MKVTNADLYTGRAVVIQRNGVEIKGKVLLDDDCGPTSFCFAPDSGGEMCVARSAIVRFGK